MTTRRETMFMPLAAAAALSPWSSAQAHRSAKVTPSAHRGIKPYRAASVQTASLPTFTRDGQFIPEAMRANIERVCTAIRRGADEVGARLYVFSEFCLQRQVSALTAEQWLAGAIRVPGPEIDAIAKAAQQAKAYVAFNPIEAIPAFPGRYFLSGVLIGPTGNVELNYRKLYDLTNKTRPTDLLERWLERFGPDSLFPVADTEIGRVAVTVGSDLAWPEMARSLVFRGAEVITNCYGSPSRAPGFVPSREAGAPDLHDPLVPVMARRMRAYENLAYVLTTNLGPDTVDTTAPLADMQPSELIDYTGNLLAVSRDNSEQYVTATLDVEALRRARCKPGPQNLLVQLQTSLHGPDYASANLARPNPFGVKLLVDGSEHGAAQLAEVQDLIRRGILASPADPD